MTLSTLKLSIQGMHCQGCEQTIEHAVVELVGVQQVRADFKSATAEIVYDAAIITTPEIQSTILKLGYQIITTTAGNNISILYRVLTFVGLLILVGGLTFWGKNQMPALMQQMNTRMSYLMLLGVGFLTGFHCIGMCGSFVMSYARNRVGIYQSTLAHIQYGLGKTTTYSLLGAGFGYFGSVITITPQIRGYAALFAGMFLILFGLKMLEFIPALRHLGFRLPAGWVREVSGSIRQHKNPLFIGLLSGFLLGCGPLQAMYIMAAGNGNPQEGALMLMCFGLGTLGPLIGFGFFANLLSATAMRQMVHVSGILVIIMGAMMLSRGYKMSGIELNAYNMFKAVTSL